MNQRILLSNPTKLRSSFFLNCTKGLLLLLLLFTATLRATAQQPDSLWTKFYGGIDYDRGNSMIQTSDGGLAIIGEFGGFTEAGIRRKGQVWLVKTDASGDTLWTRKYKGSDYDLGNAVRQTADGGYILAGYTPGGRFNAVDAWLIRTDAFGDTLWTKTYGTDAEESANDVIETADGGFVFTGFAWSSKSSRDRDVWLVKTDSVGDTLWTGRFYSGDAENVGNKVLETNDGGYVVVGTTQIRGQNEDLFLISTDEDGDEHWTKTYNKTDGSRNGIDQGRDIIELEDDGFMILGFSDTNSWLLRTDTSGDTLWTKELSINGESFAQTLDGGLVIAGGGVLRADKLGEALWEIQNLKGISNSIEQTSDGGYVISGYNLNYENNTLEDLWIFRLGPDGSVTSNQPDNEIPVIANLHQNYPNPFNPVTIIGYDLPASGNVRLKVFDMIGRQVALLVDSPVTAGRHQVSFDASGLSSGIYIYRLQIEMGVEAGQVFSRKLTVIK